MDFKAYKLHVKNTEHSKKIQDWAFSKGYGWGFNRERGYSHLDEPYLFLSKEGYIAYAVDKEYYEKHHYEEVILSQLTSPKLREVKVGDLRKSYFDYDDGGFFMYTVLSIFEENKLKFCKVMILERSSTAESGQIRTFLYKDVVEDRRIG